MTGRSARLTAARATPPGRREDSDANSALAVREAVTRSRTEIVLKRFTIVAVATLAAARGMVFARSRTDALSSPTR